MTPIEGIKGPTPTAMGPHPLTRANAAAASEAAIGRALVAVQPSARGESARDGHHRALASYLAHLIATDQQLPQTRERRRTEPGAVAAAYGATARIPLAPAGRVLSRSL